MEKEIHPKNVSLSNNFQDLRDRKDFKCKNLISLKATSEVESNISILRLVIDAFASKTIDFITGNFISHYFHICKNSYLSNLYSAQTKREDVAVGKKLNDMKGKNERMKRVMGLCSLEVWRTTKRG